MITRFIDRCAHGISEGYSSRIASSIFFKAIAFYTFIKIVLLWKVTSTVAQWHHVEFPKSWSLSKLFLLLSFGVSFDPSLFFIGALLLLAVTIWQGPNYLTNVLLCWICINLYTINFATGDGSDLNLLILSIYALPLADRPRLKNEIGNHGQVILFNASRILIRCHVAFIYLNSGVDKMLSDSWRSGDALNRIRHYEGLFNPTFPNFLQSGGWDTFFSWATIATELTIALLIWIKPLRAAVLVLAILFHLMIWWMVTLPDFAIVMIVSLLIFVDDDQYTWLQNLKSRSRVVSYVRR
ncbi:MAG: HTTM domain-containing protein [Chryseolinea sp.]